MHYALLSLGFPALVFPDSDTDTCRSGLATLKAAIAELTLDTGNSPPYCETWADRWPGLTVEDDPVAPLGAIVSL